jgi:FkbM family methyltransferase
VSRLRRVSQRLTNKAADVISWQVAWRVHDRLGALERDGLDHRTMHALLSVLLEPDSSLLDVGANEGVFLSAALRFAPSGRHWAWEPLPVMAQSLRERFPSVEVRGAALGDEPGEADFIHLIDSHGQSGFHERNLGSDTARETIRVKVERLDDVLDPNLTPAVIKVDVEGAELGVFRGARETIARHRPVIMFEHMVDAAEYFGARSEDLWDLLCADCRLRIYDLNGAGPYSREEFADAVGLRTRWNWLARP